jgi:polyphosphate kinase
LLYEPGLPDSSLDELIHHLNLRHANIVEGGPYHNLRDLTTLPLPPRPGFQAGEWLPKMNKAISTDPSIFEQMEKQDLMIHSPYQSYHPVLRFFNEAAIRQDVREIYVTIYRVATESQIMNALISAARNGKKVIVFVELKARFDEANNLQWAKKMKAA